MMWYSDNPEHDMEMYECDREEEANDIDDWFSEEADREYERMVEADILYGDKN